jgi:hypothetical protein
MFTTRFVLLPEQIVFVPEIEAVIVGQVDDVCA